MLSKGQISKINAKRDFKLFGRLLFTRWVNSRFFEFALFKGNSKRNKRVFMFNCNDKNVIDAVCGFDLRSRVKVRFKIKTNNVGEKYYTNLVAVSIEPYLSRKKAEEIKQADMFADKQYINSNSLKNDLNAF